MQVPLAAGRPPLTPLRQNATESNPLPGGTSVELNGEMMTSVEVGMMTPPTPVAVKPLPVNSSLRLPIALWMNSARVSTACCLTVGACVARSSWYFWTMATGAFSVFCSAVVRPAALGAPLRRLLN